MAMRIIAESARLLGAPRLIPIASAHIDGALYHGNSGTLFAESAGRRRRPGHGARDAQCRGARPDGLLARPARGADALDGAAHDGGLPQARLRAELDLRALSGGAPAGARQRRRLGRVQRRRVLQFGARRTHQPLWRFSRHRLRDCRPRARLRPAPAGEPPGEHWSSMSPDCRASFLGSDIAWPILGSLYGREVGNTVGVVTGIASHPGEDALKAFGAAAASSGAVGLFHIAGVTPEAPDADNRTWRSAGRDGDRRQRGDGADAQARLSTAAERRRHRRRGDRQPASVVRRIRPRSKA